MELRLFAQWLVASRPRAALLTTMLLFLFGPMSGVVIALATLEHGPDEGAAVTGLSLSIYLALLLAVRFVLGAEVPFGLALEWAFACWAPVLVMAWVWVRKGSLNLGWQLCCAAAALVVVAAFVLVGDLLAVWHVRVDRFFDAAVFEVQEPLRGQFVKGLAPVAQGALTAWMVALGLIALAVGRWWHRLLHDQAGIGGEFRRIRLGKVLALFAVAVVLGAWLLDSAMMSNLVVLFVVLLVVQGLSVAHYLTIEGNWPRYLLVVAYLLVFLLPLGAPFFAALGLVDNVVDTRAYLHGGAGPADRK